MKKLFRFALYAIVIAAFFSCGTAKKLERAQSDVERLNGELSQANNKVSTYEKQVADLHISKSTLEKNVADCNKANDGLVKENQSFKTAIAEEEKQLELIEKKVEEGLQKFADAGADVEYKDGLLHVSLPDQLLFKKGSTSIGKDGIEAIGILGKIMNESPNLNLLVVGNTDTTHVKGKADNWSLSTERANTVVRILRDTYQVDPARLTAAGKGKYNPVADNSTEAGRSKNRRIDFIINADLEKIWGLVE